MNQKMFAVITVACLATIPAFGQNQQTQGQNRQAGQQAQWQNADHALASCVAISNQEEIAIAKFAEEKSRNNEVKDFAKMLQKDHQAFLQKLQRFAPEASREGYLNDQRTSSTQPNAGNQGTVQPAGAQAPVKVGEVKQTGLTPAGQQLDFMALHRELAENCLQMSKEMLNKKDAAKFDECFIGMQIGKHAEMKNKLTVFERHASGELKQIFAEGLQATENHLKKAEDIIKRLSDAHSSSSKTSG
jgi:predicted outer membrane protein